MPDGTGLKVGYISLGDSVPFVKLVSDGIRTEAAAAHLDFQFCDSQIDAAKALACAQSFKLKGVQGVLNFQVTQKSSPEICAAYGGVPTIAIDIVQQPCQVAFMGANNALAGKLGGEAMGQYAKTTWNCQYTAYVSLESSAAGDANTARMGGYRTGFTEFCPITNQHILDPADRTDTALAAVTNLLPALPGNRIIVVAINEDGIIGAEGAAKTLGRATDLYYSGQGTDPSIWKDVACNPNYIASVAYFPERYGSLLIPNIIAELKGQTIPPLIYTQHIVVTKDNIRTVYPATPSC
jgi:ribose transport system substrate-binding protein